MQYTTSAGYRQVQAKLRSFFVIINIYNLLYIATHLQYITLWSVQYSTYKRYMFQMYTSAFSVH